MEIFESQNLDKFWTNYFFQDWIKFVNKKKILGFLLIIFNSFWLSTYMQNVIVYDFLGAEGEVNEK